MVKKTWTLALAVLLSPLFVCAQDFNDSPDCNDENYVALIFPKPKVQEIELVTKSASPSMNLALSIVDFAQQFLGTRYRIQRIFKEVGLELPRSSVAQANYAKRIELNEVRTGDLIFFKGRNRGSSSVGHVAMVSNVSEDGSIEIIHATNHGGVMKENPFKNEYFAPRYLFAARVLQD